MARVLIVGCGCRGRELARALAADGHAVRGTTRDPSKAAEIEAAGAEAVVADPDRLSTLLPAIDSVSVCVWLLGSASGNADDLHGPRLESFVERLVDTHVRGFAYEAAGSVDPALLERGAVTVRLANATWGMPIGLIQADPGDHEAWLAAARGAVAEILAG